MSVIFNDMGETVHPPQRARDIERRADETRLKAQQMQGFAEMLTLMAQQMRAIEEDEASYALDALVTDELAPRINELLEQAADIERYGNV